MKKLGDEHIQIVYIHDKFCDEISIFLFCATLFRALILSFLHRGEKLLFHHEIYHVCR